MKSVGQLLNGLFFILYLLSKPHVIPLLFKKIYMPIYVQFEWLKDYDVKTVIDVGANSGHVSKALIQLFPKASVFAFEPIPEEVEKIKTSISSKNLTVENLALSNKVGKADFYSYNYSPASSLLPASGEYVSSFKGVSKANKISVKTTTLDKYFEGKNLKKKVFLKIDTQGSEKLILEGGKKLLKNVSIIHVEVPFGDLYKDQSNFGDIYNLLTSAGFSYAGTINESNFYPNFSLDTAANLVFFNKND